MARASASDRTSGRSGIHRAGGLREVQDGKTFVVTSRGRPVVKVTPVSALKQQGPAVDALLDFVETLPRRHAGAWRREDLYE